MKCPQLCTPAPASTKVKPQSNTVLAGLSNHRPTTTPPPTVPLPTTHRMVQRPNAPPTKTPAAISILATHGMPIQKTVRSNIERSVSITMLQILTLTLIQHQDGHRTLGNKDHPHISSAPQYSGIPPLHTPQPPTAPSIIP